MKMNKTRFAVIALQLSWMLFAVGCATTNAQVNKQESRLDFEVVDWQGASFGGEIPDWVRAATEDKERLERLDSIGGEVTYKNKAVRLTSASGRDIDLLKAWVQNKLAGEIASEIKQTVTKTAGNHQQGNKDGDAALKMIDETIGIFSTVTISGFERSREFWVKRRMKATGETDFQYIAVYVIDKENLMFQIDRALGKIEAKTAEEQKALTDIQTLIKTSAAGAGYIDFGKGE